MDGGTTTGRRPAKADAGPTTRRAVVRCGAWAGVVYVLAWLIGLLLAPSAPDPFGSASTVNAYFSAHRSAAMVQSVLIHGLAGLALLGLAAGLSIYLLGKGRWSRTLMVVAAALAAMVSFLQVAFMIEIFVHVGQGGDEEGTKTLFDAINKADTAKLIVLSLFVAAACWAGSRGALSRWLVLLGAITVVLLILGGLAFLIEAGVLNVALDISLIVLLVWAGGTSVRMLRGKPPGKLATAG